MFRSVFSVPPSGKYLMGGIFLLLLLLFPFASKVSAQWLGDGIAICTADHEQSDLAEATDAQGGMLMVWTDLRDGYPLNRDIYAQRVDVYGYPQWGDSNGLAVTTSGATSQDPDICPDGSGGAWIVWKEYVDPNSTIYGKHIDSEGNTVWGGATGYVIANDTSRSFYEPVCDSDGLGGMVVVWRRVTVGEDSLMAQKVDASGTLVWNPNGVTVGESDDDVETQVLCRSDGGAFVIWHRNIEIVAQRLSSAGEVLWDPNGVTPWASAAGDYEPRATLDGNGGVIIAWRAQNLIDNDYRIFAQRLDADGNSMFFADPYPPEEAVLWVSEFHDIDAGSLSICSDGAGGAVVAWEVYDDFSGYPEYQAIYAQRVNSIGYKQWGDDPVQVSASNSDQLNPHIVPCGDGTVVVWNGHMQRLSADGLRQLGDSYHDVSLACSSPNGVVAGRNGQVLVDWVEWYVNDDDKDIWAMSFNRDGLTPEFNLKTIMVSYPADTAHISIPVQPTVEVTNAGNIDPSPFTLSYYRDLSAPPTSADVATSSTTVTSLAPGDTFRWNPPEVVVNYPSVWHSYAFADPQDEVIESDENDNIHGPVELTWIGWPDLWIMEISLSDSFPPSGKEITATIIAFNGGSEESLPCDLDFYIDLPDPPATGQSGDFTFRLPSMSSMTGYMWTTPPFTHAANSPVTYHCYAQVDTQNEIDEGPISEDDNISAPTLIHWTWGVDLDITGFTINEGAPSAPAGRGIGGAIKIFNSGYLTASNPVINFHQNLPNAPVEGDPADQTIIAPSLAPGDSFLWNLDPFSSDEIGLWKCWAKVDPPEEIGEFDEDNNVAGPSYLTWDAPVQEGWPVSVGGTCTSPVIAALITDPPAPRAVIIGSSDGRCYAFDGSGHSLPGWPYDPGLGSPISAAPAVGIVHGTDSRQVVFANEAGMVYCVGADGSMFSPLWTFDAGDEVKATPVLADFDGDGLMETVVATSHGEVFLLSPDGVVQSGWPVDVGDTLSASPAVADLDLDGTPEIVTVGNNAKIGGKLYVLRPDGSMYSSQWPVSYSTIAYSPAIGDVLGDDRLEIVFTDALGYLHALQVNPSDPSLNLALPHPVHSSPALADLVGGDGGKVEIVVATEFSVGSPPMQHLESEVYAIDADGSVLPGWPVSFTSNLYDVQAGAAPVIWGSDIETMIAVGSHDSRCRVANYKGQPMYGYTMPANGPITESLAVGDLDADGHMEVIVPGGGKLACYDLLAGSYSPDRLSWPMWGHDMSRTRSYGHGTVTAAPPLPDMPVVSRARLYAPHPNPFNPRVVLPYATARPGHVELTVYDLAGRRVRTLVAKDLPAGRHEVTWNGVDERGRRVGSGVYFLRLDSAGQSDRCRVTLVK